MNENTTPAAGGVCEVAPSPELIDGIIGLLAHEILAESRAEDIMELAQAPGGPESGTFDAALSVKIDQLTLAKEAHLEAHRHGL